MTKDAIGNEIQVGDCVVYIQKRRGGDTLGKGVVLKLNKARHRIQPLRVHTFEEKYLGFYRKPNMVKQGDGRYAIPVDVYNVEGHRLAVMPGTLWPEYQQFVKNNWLDVPLSLDSLI